MPTLTWTAIDLSSVRTDVLAALDVRHGPSAARNAVLAELAARQSER
jgi:hypothetical protein